MAHEPRLASGVLETSACQREVCISVVGREASYPEFAVFLAISYLFEMTLWLPPDTT